MSKVRHLPPNKLSQSKSRADLFEVSLEDLEEWAKLDTKLSELLGQGEFLPVDEMLNVLFMLVAQLRRRVKELEAVAHPPLGQQSIYQRLEALEALMREDGRMV